MKKVDVAIIGTGPGGGMAACRLAKTGLKVLVLEKSKLPRHKACGGALSLGVKKLIDWDFSSLIEAEVVAAKYFHNYTLPKVIFPDERSQDKISPAFMVNRSRFDYHFIERAISLGKGNVSLWDGFRVAEVGEDDNGVSIRGENQETIRTEFLIAADGATSVTAKCLGLNQKAGLALAVDTEIEVGADVYNAEKRFATFNLNFPTNGYSWIFPKAGYLSCGVMSWTRQKGLSKTMNEFLEKSLPQESIKSAKTLSHPIPLYNGHRQIATRRVCLVGDAANLVDPFLGEGIRYALASGALAADIITSVMAKELEHTDEDCRSYQKVIHQSIGKHLNSIRRFTLNSFLYAPELAYRSFVFNENCEEIYKQLSFLRAFGMLPV